MLVHDEINFRQTDENTKVITVSNPAETDSFYFGIGDDFGDAPISLNFPIRNIVTNWTSIVLIYYHYHACLFRGLSTLVDRRIFQQKISANTLALVGIAGLIFG